METTTGTSLEVLAPFLPYGIKVETPEGRMRIEGVWLSGGVELTCVDLEFGHDYTYGLEDVLPVLKPFSALVTPLPSGEIPAVEVAKLSLSGAVAKYADWSKATAEKDVAGAKVTIPDTRQAYFPGYYHIWNDWTDLNWQAVDYLRSKHFAVGLSESQFIPK